MTSTYKVFELYGKMNVNFLFYIKEIFKDDSENSKLTKFSLLSLSYKFSYEIISNLKHL